MNIKRLANIALSAMIVFSAVFPVSAFATVDEEKETATEEETAAALESGVEGMPSTDEAAAQNESDELTTADMDEAYLQELEASFAAGRGIKLYSISGDTRYDTAAVSAKTAYPDGVSSKTAIVVSGEDNAWADSLSASSLAGLIDCPILYVAYDWVPNVTADTLRSFGIQNILLIGGDGVVNTGVEESLKGICSNVTRICGSNRYQTQLAVYNYGCEQGTWSSNVIVSSGSAFADALSASPVAYAQKMPIFLVPSGGGLTTEQTQALVDSNVESFTILGGSSAVSAFAEGFLTAILAKKSSTYDSSNISRLYGENRYTTSWEIARWGVDTGYLTWNYAGLASGEKAADALAGCVTQGKTRAPIMLLTNDNLDMVENLSWCSPENTRIFGGTAIVSQLNRNYIARKLGYGLAQIQGFKVYVDAGHGYNNTGNGGYDSGACGCGYEEADLTQEQAQFVAAHLQSDGIDVFLNDDGGPYKYRHAEAIAQGCNVIISIHFNAGGGTGSMTLLHSYNANEYSWTVASIMQPYLVAGTELTDRGIVEQEVAILGGDLPAVLLEVAFIDNSYDMEKYQERKWAVSDQITYGIENL